MLAALLLVVATADAGFCEAVSNASQADDILQGHAGPCDPGTASADVTPNTDVNGNPVAPADLATGPIPPLSGQIVLPLPARRGQRGVQRPAYVGVDAARLGPLLNPEPGCAAPAH